MSSFSIPSFGYSPNSPQGYGSPKTHHSTQVYQPMPAVGTPSFGGFGRPHTPADRSRHSSYVAKEVEPTVQTIQPSVERVRRHREYYLEGGDIYFLVENYLFRVHKYFFERESPVFRKQFADSALNGRDRIGTSDNEPLILQDVRTDDFSRFLWVFYNPIYSIYDATAEDWAAILGLAHHWQFSEVKSLVVREFEKQVVPSIYKIVTYHRYEVDRGLLLPSYMDLISREETLSFEEAKDLGLETSLMIMTAREIVRKGEAPTSVVKVSQEELRNIIRQVFRFPGPRSDSPLSDITAAEPALDHRSPPLLAEKTDLPTVPEHENEPITLTASASLNSPLPPVIETPAPAPAPVTATPTPPAPIFPTKKQQQKQTPATPKKEDTKPAPVSPPKEEAKPREAPAKPTSFPMQNDEPKSTVQEPVKPVTADPPKPEVQDGGKKPLLSRLADVSKGAGSPSSAKDAATSKDKEGDKPTDNKEAKDAKSTVDEKDAAGPPASGLDPNGTPNGTPLLNQDASTGQSVSAKKAKTLLARAGEVKRTGAAQETHLSSKGKETDPSSRGKDKETDLGNKGKGKGKETLKESLKAPSTTNPTTLSLGSEPGELEPVTKEVEAKTGVDGGGEERGRVKTDSPGDEKKVDVKQDTKKPGGAIYSSDNVASTATTNETTKPATGDTKVIPRVAATNKASDPEVGSSVKEKAVPAVDGKTVKPEENREKVELVVTDEGDVATPKRTTKELPISPAKSFKEKPVPTLTLTVPKAPKNRSDPLSTTTVTDSTSSPLQKVLEHTEDETLMERMARLNVVNANYQPPKDPVPPAHTDLESEFNTAPSGPSTPRSKAEKSFNLMLQSEVPLSDDDEFFLDWSPNASVSNFDGV